MSTGSAWAKVAARARVASAEVVITPWRNLSQMFVAMVVSDSERSGELLAVGGKAPDTSDAEAGERSSPSAREGALICVFI